MREGERGSAQSLSPAGRLSARKGATRGKGLLLRLCNQIDPRQTSVVEKIFGGLETREKTHRISDAQSGVHGAADYS
jgi:hypothetical protein